jgi:hypothetical protein
MLMFGRLNGHARGEIDVARDKLESIILLARVYEAGGKDESSREIGPGSSEQAERDLRKAIDALSEDERAVLVALSSIGRGDFRASEFDRALTLAFDRRGGSTSDYLLGLPMLADLLENGAFACGAESGSAPPQGPNGTVH